jgi:hypothetical protein
MQMPLQGPLQMLLLHPLLLRKLQQMLLQHVLRQRGQLQMLQRLQQMHRKPPLMLPLPLHSKSLRMLQMLLLLLPQRKDVLMLQLCKQRRIN